MNTNGHDTTLVQTPDEIQKRKYLDRVWAMNKEQMFAELMRVHSESTRMMGEAQTQIEELLMRISQHEGLQ
jgi:hypothetical protein